MLKENLNENLLKVDESHLYLFLSNGLINY